MASATPDHPVVLITGASGLIGSLIAADLGRDHVVVGLDVKEPAGRPGGMEFQHCDLTDDESPRRVLEEVAARHGRRVASVIHLAAYYDFAGEPSSFYEELTVKGTRRLLRALGVLDVEQVVFSSTLLVMRPAAPGEIVEEDSPLEGAWDYPRSKIEAERVLREESGEIPVVVLRIAGAYDEDGHSPPIVQQLVRIRDRRFESFFFPGDAHHGQPFVHLDDVVSCFRRTVEARGRLDSHEVFLVAEPDLMTYGELQDAIGELVHGREWPTIRVPGPLAKAGAWVRERMPGGEESFVKPWMVDLADAHYPVSIARARDRLGWEPRRRLRETLPEMVARLERDPAGFYRMNGLGAPADADAEKEGR